MADPAGVYVLLEDGHWWCGSHQAGSTDTPTTGGFGDSAFGDTPFGD